MASHGSARWLVLAAALMFSTGGTVVKLADLSIWQIACLRSAIAGSVLAWLAPSWRRGWNGRVLLVGAAFAATMILFVAGNRLTTAANTIFLQATAPIYLLFLGPLLLGERPRRADLGFAALLAIGMAMFFVGSESPVETAPNPRLGNILGVFAGMTWALTLVGLRSLGRTFVQGPHPDGPRRDAAGTAVLAGSLIAAVVCLPLSFPWTMPGAVDLGAVTYLGVVQIGLAYVCMTRGMRNVGAFEASLLLLLEPVASTFWAWLFHGEQPGFWSLTGCLLILAATVARTLLARPSHSAAVAMDSDGTPG